MSSAGVGQGWVDHKGWCTENSRRIAACYWMKRELYEEWHCDLNVVELHRWQTSCVRDSEDKWNGWEREWINRRLE